MMKKKAVALVLAAGLSAGMLSGCGTGNGDSKNTDELPEITTYMPYFKLGNAQCIADEIGKLAGVKFNPLSSAGSSEGVQRSALIVTTGEKVNWVNIDTAQPFKQWGEEGVVNNLQPYIEKYKDELPVLNMIVNDPIFKGFKGSNGEIYAIPEVNYVTNSALRMNKAWLEEIGAETPQTLDEITEILRKFKSVASKEDSAVPYSAGSLSDFSWVFYAYGGRLYSGGYPKYYEKDGEFLPYDISDMNKEALKYVRNLYQEGLVNEDWQILSTTGTDSHNNFVSGKAGMIFGAGGTDEELYQNKGTVSEWLPAPEGPTGIKSYGGEAPYWLFGVIPSSISEEKDIYNTLKFIEWMHSEEARKLCCYGIEGRHYEMKDGKIDYTAHKENMDADFGIGQNSNFEWGWVSPYKGALDPKYGTVSEAVANIKLFEVVKKEPVDENYMEYIKFMSQWIEPYKYSSYINDDLKFTANAAIELTDKFYSQAITSKSFDFDKEWEKFKEQYMNEYKGKECLEIFKKIAEETESEK